MKSIYLNDRLHRQLKILASLEKKSLTEIVSEFLEIQLNKQLTDLPAYALQKLAESGESFDFLKNSTEDIYDEFDGEPLS